MFKIVEPPKTFTVDVQLGESGPAADGKLKVEYRYIAPADLLAWQLQFGHRPVFDGLADVIVGWSGYVDAEGAPVEFSVDALKTLCDQFYSIPDELLRAWRLGLTEVRPKN